MGVLSRQVGGVRDVWVHRSRCVRGVCALTVEAARVGETGQGGV